MNIRCYAIGFTLALAACGTSEQAPVPEATPTEAAQATTGEEGSGAYATDCTDIANGYVVNLVKGEDGMVAGEVETAGKTYSNLLTSYSFMGDSTPPDFLIAVIFDEADAPVDASDEDGPRLEIWKEDGSFYALVNGDKANKLALCPA